MSILNVVNKLKQLKDEPHNFSNEVDWMISDLEAVTVKENVEDSVIGNPIVENIVTNTTNNEPVDEYGLTDKMKEYLLTYILSVEGGYFNHPNDPGGPTRYGIIQEEARRWGYKGDMRNFPKELAIKIYLKDYWGDIKLMNIKSFNVALCIFDMQVNGGTAGALIAQRTVNRLGVDKLVEDRKLGPKSFAAINRCNPDEFIKKYCELQRSFYVSISNNNHKLKVFLKGWYNRVNAKIRFIEKMKADGIE